MEIRLHEDDLVGTFRTPSGSAGPFPGILALGGSDGGTPEYFLNLFVPEGFACLALAYWGTSHTQPTMVEIPLERIERGLRWLIRVWGTGRMCRMMVHRMSTHGRAGEITHLHYPRAGHMLFPYVRPSDAMFPAYRWISAVPTPTTWRLTRPRGRT